MAAARHPLSIERCDVIVSVEMANVAVCGSDRTGNGNFTEDGVPFLGMAVGEMKKHNLDRSYMCCIFKEQ